MTWQKFIDLFNTDALAIGAIAGLGVTLVISIGIFVFLLTRKDRPRQQKA